MAVDVSIILPTLNEAENLPVIIPEIDRVLRASQIRYDIIVADDGSTDGTQEIISTLGKKFPIRLLDRRGKPRSLSHAVIDGFAISDAQVVVVMDADLSHAPEQLPALVQPVLNGDADIMVGSRHVPGGEMPDWPWYRRMVSAAAARLSFGLTPLSDPTSGLMAVRRSLLDLSKLDPIGWKIVLEVVARYPNARTQETPIVFRDRSRGKSKLGLREQFQYLQHLVRLRRTL
jgi:dolichol-phosphate mannosyltransferase